MSDLTINAHVELRENYPIAWIARLVNDPENGAQLVIVRVDQEVAPSLMEERAEFYVPDGAGDGFQLVDDTHRIAFLQTVQLIPEVDPHRPVLQLTAVATSAFRQPDWPFVFGHYNDADPMAGIYVSINTPRDVQLGWVEGSLLKPGTLTVDDVVGRS